MSILFSFLQTINESPALNLLITVVAFLCFVSLLIKQIIDDKLASTKKVGRARCFLLYV